MLMCRFNTILCVFLAAESSCVWRYVEVTSLCSILMHSNLGFNFFVCMYIWYITCLVVHLNCIFLILNILFLCRNLKVCNFVLSVNKRAKIKFYMCLFVSFIMDQIFDSWNNCLDCFCQSWIKKENSKIVLC